MKSYEKIRKEIVDLLAYKRLSKSRADKILNKFFRIEECEAKGNYQGTLMYKGYDVAFLADNFAYSHSANGRIYALSFRRNHSAREFDSFVNQILWKMDIVEEGGNIGERLQEHENYIGSLKMPYGK